MPTGEHSGGARRGGRSQPMRRRERHRRQYRRARAAGREARPWPASGGPPDCRRTRAVTGGERERGKAASRRTRHGRRSADAGHGAARDGGHHRAERPGRPQQRSGQHRTGPSPRTPRAGAGGISMDRGMFRLRRERPPGARSSRGGQEPDIVLQTAAADAVEASDSSMVAWRRPGRRTPNGMKKPFEHDPLQHEKVRRAALHRLQLVR